MRYTVDILKRFQSVYGFVGANLQGLLNRGIFMAGVAYNDRKYQRQSNDVDYKDLHLYPVAEYNFADMTFKGVDPVTNEQRELVFSFGSLLESSEGIIAPPPMVSFRRSKNLGITTIDDGDEAEIIENFGINSWEIDLKGLLIDMDNHLYPKSRVVDIARFFEINDVIEIVSPLFQDLGITSVYFREQTIEPLEAFPDTVKFSLKAKSIKPAEFSILNG